MRVATRTQSTPEPHSGPRFPDESESVLLARAAEGDLDAFGVIYRRYQQVVYRFARAMTGSADAAEDVTQEVFIALLTKAGRYDPARAGLATYMYGIVRNLSRARLRRDSRRLSVENLTLGSRDISVEDHSIRLEQDELVASMRRALVRLPSRYRELIVLCDLHGLSYQEAAVVVGSSIGAVRSRLHRGRQLLKLRLTRTSRSISQPAMTPMRVAV
jgi:RNA polymerase sigma-70 factor, ECF subfamily